ncbi:pilus assembly protein [Chitinimonas lacunae]|uniref:Pilus assembly protein n=1 Tax=Chitinimonas lacunae TaxID=1963018 RepID=A0ABV8MUJ1_9NEIS
MNPKLSRHRVRHIVSCTLGAFALLGGQLALATDISNEPLATKPASSKVKHNLMFILDNSGSMNWAYTPDWVVGGNMCRVFDFNGGNGRTDCIDGMPPYYSSDINSQYYNPDITYSPPKKSNGKDTYPNMDRDETMSWTKVTTDAYGKALYAFYDRLANSNYYHKYNLAKEYPDLIYGAGKRNTSTESTTANGNYVYPDSSNRSVTVTYTSNPYYYRLKSSIYCSDDLMQCQTQAGPDKDRPRQVKVLWCDSASNSAKCVGRRDDNVYRVPGYMSGKGGPYNFQRVDIKPDGSSYPKAETRSDCKGTTCTYDEEMTNFANWFTYYRTRMQTMKSAGSIAFSAVKGERFRVGFISLHNNTNDNYSFLQLGDFEGTQRDTWYNKLINEVPGSGTPLPGALARVGRYYAGKTDAVTGTAKSPAIQYACQKNFALLTTDGYWNSSNTFPPLKIDGSQLNESYDSDPATRKYGIYDGKLSSGSLADVAAYYYQTDLLDENTLTGTDKERALNKYGEALAEASDKGDVKNKAQRMTTFTLGLGVDGEMLYQPNYTEASTGDFRDIIDGKRDWPKPAENRASAVDDLWHAAVNGRGSYQSAKQPQQVVEALRGILNRADAAPGAAAAPTSTSPVFGDGGTEDQFAFATTYQTISWTGKVIGTERVLDTNTKQYVTQPIAGWEPHAQLLAYNSGADKSQASKRRNIFTYDGSKQVPFKFESLDSTAKLWLEKQSKQLSQYDVMTTAQRTLADSGINMVEYLRGDQTLEANGIFRKRAGLLGDTAGGQATFWQQNNEEYSDNEYMKFRETQKNRLAMVYVPANDGMLHAFIKKTKGITLQNQEEDGAELWAYVPRMVMKNMPKLASKEYTVNHQFFVDGEPKIEDVWDGKKWRTILVGGLNAGGRGYYALDVTDPRQPEVLWEFCGDKDACSGEKYSDKMGLSFGRPQIFKLPPNSVSPGTWVVAFGSGYNGSKDGTQPGRLFVVDAITGKPYYQMDSGGDGLAHITGWAFKEEQLTDKTAQHLFGGDLDGNIWQFDLGQTNPNAKPTKLAELKKNSVKQPVTTPLLLSSCNDKPVVIAGTGRLLGDSDLLNKDDQSIYVFRMDVPAGEQLLNKHSKMVQQVFDYTKLGPDRGSMSRQEMKPVDFATQNGWYMDFESKTGERVNVSPKLLLGGIAVATNTPQNSSGNVCEAGGTSSIYYFGACDGKLKVDVYLHTMMAAGFNPQLTTDAKGEPTAELDLLDTAGNRVKVNLGKLKYSGTLRAKRASWREILPDN